MYVWLVASAQKDYRENRENGLPSDSPKRPFPSAGFDALDIKSSTYKPDGPGGEDFYPDKQGRHWLKLTLNDGRVLEDFYWTKDEVRGYPDKSNKDRYWYIMHHAPTGTKIEGFSQEPDRNKGFPDKDRNYWYCIKYTECGDIKAWMEEKDLNYLRRIKRENPNLYQQEIANHKDHPAVKQLMLEASKEQAQQQASFQPPPFQPHTPQQVGFQSPHFQRQVPPQQFGVQPPYFQSPPQQQGLFQPSLFQPQAQQQPAGLHQPLAVQPQIPAQQASPQSFPFQPQGQQPGFVQPSQQASKPSLSHSASFNEHSFTIPSENIQLTRELGEGAFGKVFAGQWGYEDVAVKQLHLQKMSENALTEFKQEAAIMSGLRSNYIVQLRGICLTPYALVMEYMQGGSLFNLLHSSTILPWVIRHRIASDIAKGLAFLHSYQPHMIIHRDLKSQNVLLTEHHRAKLADFGLANVRIESSRTQCYAQSSSKSVGTIPWMAPECFGLRPKYSEKSDMYAYGMVLWELTSRKMPYKEVVDPNEIRVAVKDGEREEVPDETTQPREMVPVSFKEVIRLCWFQDPAKRPTAKKAIESLGEPAQSAAAYPAQSSGSSSSGSNSGLPSGFIDNFASF